MRLPRPYVPWLVRDEVIDRQMKEAGFRCSFVAALQKNIQRRVKWKLEEFFAGKPVELHHRPALMNRRQYTKGQFGKVLYTPHANDPEYLVYLPADEHDIETRVRGQHGDYSDLAKARKRKRKERKAKRPKFKWPKRKFK